jgi:hypothetical protein
MTRSTIIKFWISLSLLTFYVLASSSPSIHWLRNFTILRWHCKHPRWIVLQVHLVIFFNQNIPSQVDRFVQGFRFYFCIFYWRRWSIKVTFCRLIILLSLINLWLKFLSFIIDFLKLVFLPILRFFDLTWNVLKKIFFILKLVDSPNLSCCIGIYFRQVFLRYILLK